MLVESLDTRHVEQMIATRRDLHMHPEISSQEHRTAALVADRLREIGVDGLAGCADTGVVAWVVGEQPGPTVLLRADIDALPITELDHGQSYLSQTPGAHHGCGHDGHTAILLAVAGLLVERRPKLPGSVLLFFQPAEEWGGGARRMLDSRAWPEELAPSAALALHLTTAMELGEVDVRPGPVTSAAQSFDVGFRSPGGHAAAPHLTPDPVVAAAAFIMAAQTVVSRSLDPRSQTVVSFTVIQAGEVRSAIPVAVDIQGTVRSYTNEDLARVQERVRAIADGVAATHGCMAVVDFKDDAYPTSVNDAVVAAAVTEAACDLLGADHVRADMVISGADDMGEILLDHPGCYFFVGAANSRRGLTAPMHSPEFDFDEAALEIGARVMLAAVERVLIETRVN